MSHKKLRIQASFAFSSVVSLLVALAIACGGDSNETKSIKEKIIISSAYCQKYNKDYLPYMACYATVTNNSNKKIKDIELRWTFLSKTDTEVHSVDSTIMDFFEPGKAKTVSKKEIPDPSILFEKVKQTAKYKCTVEKFLLAEE